MSDVGIAGSDSGRHPGRVGHQRKSEQRGGGLTGQMGVIDGAEPEPDRSTTKLFDDVGGFPLGRLREGCLGHPDKFPAIRLAPEQSAGNSGGIGVAEMHDWTPSLE